MARTLIGPSHGPEFALRAGCGGAEAGASSASPFGLIGAACGAVRYRFFLLAGALPYLLGAAVARRSVGELDWSLLLIGLMGVLFVGVGIEGMNEYFDSRIGGDRVFASPERAQVSWHLPVGLGGFALAGVAGIYLAFLRGWPVVYFALFGAAAALSYLMPPVHLSYRGLGELVIAISYGPGLVLGAFWLQTRRLSPAALLASALPALLILALALANEVPDYRGDSLVGKRNIVVRMGRRGATRLYLLATAMCFALIGAGVVCGWFPPLLGLAFLFAPLALHSAVLALRECEKPARFIQVIRRAILLYVLVDAVAIFSYLVR
ncbi:MAG: prenyltransferase [Candidatus Brocadiia bacterium]|jgi:1,4-dihydroxy-2-naphthoate octaprenyltransferase|nr:prenyltransferase [Candidatus Brocadiia bacterium]